MWTIRQKTNCNNPHKRRVISCWSAKAIGDNDGSAKFTIEPFKSECKKGKQYGCFYQTKEEKGVTKYKFGCANKQKCTKLNKTQSGECCDYNNCNDPNW